MPETAAPWRALEDEAHTEPGPGGPGTAGPARGHAPAWRPAGTWLMGALGVAALALAGAAWLILTSGQGTVVIEGDSRAPARSGGPAARGVVPAASGVTGGEVVVDVQGAVVRPGVVRLARGARVADAIEAAGGYGPRVAADRVGTALNLAALVRDGDQIVVPSRDDPAAGSGSGGGGGGGGAGGIGSGGSGGNGGPGGGAGGGSAGAPLDLNRASATELDALPGIGPVTAAKIIAARDEQPFASVDELRTRKILGAATFDKVKDLVIVR
jgi:competence protein ComEA